MWYRLFKKAVRVITEPELTVHQTPSMYEYPVFSLDPVDDKDPTSSLGAGSKVFGPGHYTSQNPFVQQGYADVVNKKSKPKRKRPAGVSPRPQGKWKKQNKTRWEKLPRGMRIVQYNSIPPEHASLMINRIKEVYDHKAYDLDKLEKKIQNSENITFNELKSCFNNDKEVFPMLINLGYDALEYESYTRSSVSRNKDESDEDYEKRVQRMKEAGNNILVFNRAPLVVPRIFTKSRLRPESLTVEEIDILQKEMYLSSYDVIEQLYESGAYKNSSRLDDTIINFLLDKKEDLENYNISYLTFDQALKSFENGSSPKVFNKVMGLTSENALKLVDLNIGIDFKSIAHRIKNASREIIEKLVELGISLDFYYKGFFSNISDVKYAASLGWQPADSISTDLEILKNYISEDNIENSFEFIDENDLETWKWILSTKLSKISNFEKIPCKALVDYIVNFHKPLGVGFYSFRGISLECLKELSNILESKDIRSMLPDSNRINSVGEFRTFFEKYNYYYNQLYPNELNMLGYYLRDALTQYRLDWANDLEYSDWFNIFQSFDQESYKKDAINHVLRNAGESLIKYLPDLIKNGLIQKDDIRFYGIFDKYDFISIYNIFSLLFVNPAEILKNIPLNEKNVTFLMDKFPDQSDREDILKELYFHTWTQETYLLYLLMYQKYNIVMDSFRFFSSGQNFYTLEEKIQIFQNMGIKVDIPSNIDYYINQLDEDKREDIRRKVQSLKA